MDPKRKFFLFKQSKHFCAVPWNYFKVGMNGDVATCVNGEYTLGNLKNNSIEEILNNPKLVEIRDNLIKDQPDKNCQKCQSLENVSNSYEHKHFRELYNPIFKSVDIEYDDIQSFKFSGVDLHWSSVCDLKCITCWHKQSSSIAVEERKPILHIPTDIADKLIDYIANNQEGLKEIYLSGGEPTLIKHNLHLLKRLKKDSDLVIRINTNMMFDDDNLIVRELLEFPNILVTMSADSIGDRFNYIRRGGDWNLFLKNLDKLHKTHFRWRLNSVFFVGSALYLSDTQNFFYNNYGIDDFTINQLEMDHPDLACRHLPQQLKEQCRDKLTAHQHDHRGNLNLIGQLTNCLMELKESGMPDYKDYFESVDKKAGTDWIKVFPELIYE